MTWGSLVGFAVVFVLVCTTSSALLAAGLRASRTTLAHRGPAVQRLAAELVATVPALLGFSIVAILGIASLLGTDHYGVHDHHAHLCPRHGAVWLERPWAVATLAVAAAVLLARTAILVTGFARGGRAVGRLRQLAREQHGDVRLIASERVFCFVAGVRRPADFVSTAARDALDAEEWAAMLAHEQSHVRHRDLARHYLRLSVPLQISHYEHLQRVEGASFEESVARGSMERLSPVLMTALCAGRPPYRRS